MHNNITKNKSGTIGQNEQLTIFSDNIRNKHCQRESVTNVRWDDLNNYNFNINDNEYDKFVDAYAYLFEGNKDNFGNVSYMEKPREIGPMYFDYDVKADETKLIKKKDYIKIVTTTNEVIKKYFRVKDDNILKSFLLRKSKATKTKDDIYSDGFHLHYPYLIVNKAERFLIYHEVKNKVLSDGLLSDRQEQFKKGVEDFFDSSVIAKNNWFMYGSGKRINNEINAYKLKYMFDCDSEELHDEYSEKDLVKLFSIRNKPERNTVSIRKSASNKIIEMEKKYLKQNKKSTDEFFIENNNNNKADSKISSIEIKPKTDTETDADVIDAKKLVKLLNPKRADSYYPWLYVGWALYNISPSLLPEFIAFSKTCTIKTQYNDGCCEKVWAECMRRDCKDGYKIASLHKWSKEDNLKEYTEYKQGKINKLLEDGDIRTDFDVATIIYENYKYEFVCADMEKGVWFQFSNHKWNIMQKAHGLSLKISQEITIEFAVLLLEITKKMVLGKEQDRDNYQKKSNEINAVIKNLKNKPFKDRIISEAALLFYKKDFIRTLNQNPYIIGFDNGIYDLKLGKLREGEPDDLVSKTLGYNFVELSENDETVKEIESFYEKIQPDPAVNLLLKCYTASMFEGGNKDQKMVLLIGVGSNGKGTYIDLVNGTLGDRSVGGYYDTISPTVFTQKRTGSSNATPELADKYDIRSLGFQEIDSDDQFHLGLMKSMTGQDKIPARPLYGQPFTYVPLFKLFAAMNTEPVINSDDNGTWRRILKIDFPTVFKSEPKKPNERRGDPDIREKIQGWNAAHSWLLLKKYYPIYKKNGGLEKLIPDSVRMSTDKYKSESNIFIEFVNDGITCKEGSKLEKSLAWTMFKDWYSACYNTKNEASHKKLMQYFQKNGFKVDKGVNGYVHGIKLREEDMDEL
jgi:P4 family phage/plasmid primase-like protien